MAIEKICKHCGKELIESDMGTMDEDGIFTPSFYCDNEDCIAKERAEWEDMCEDAYYHQSMVCAMNHV